MTTPFEAWKLLCATPLLALVAAWDLRSPGAEGVTIDPPPDAMAISSCTYFNSSNHNMIVGQFGLDCCNNYVAWGKKSKFYECGGCFPCVPPPE